MIMKGIINDRGMKGGKAQLKTSQAETRTTNACQKAEALNLMAYHRFVLPGTPRSVPVPLPPYFQIDRA
jgi:hypothetical protein